VHGIVLHAGIGNVDTVMVAGRVMKRHGKLHHGELARRKAELVQCSRRILGNAGLMH
jgi:hypothetical protein